MTQRFARMLVEYDGAPFQGWSRQPGKPSIEQEMLNACQALSLSGTQLTCAGRTDAGVHARHQVVSIAYTGSVPAENLASALTRLLPPEIAVVSSELCDASFNARGDATSRAYEYRVLQSRVRSPLRRRWVLHHPRPLDIAALNAAAQLTLGQHDFRAFTPSGGGHVYFDRTLLESYWTQNGEEYTYFVRANTFLRHMVRCLVGSMLAVGRGDWPLERFAALLEGAPRSDANKTALPHALCLVDVTYE